jgi:hypothetical protein
LTTVWMNRGSCTAVTNTAQALRLPNSTPAAARVTSQGHEQEGLGLGAGFVGADQGEASPGHAADHGDCRKE